MTTPGGIKAIGFNPCAMLAASLADFASVRTNFSKIESDSLLDADHPSNGVLFPRLFTTNHLGHFQLAARLWPSLRKANGARVVTLSSRGHMRSAVDFDDWNFERRAYNRWSAYGQSKTANALFAVALDSIGAEHGVRAFSVHPGGIVTDLVRHMSPEELQASGAVDENWKPVIDPDNNMKTPEQGAATTIWCATSIQLAGMGGVYCENVDIAQAFAGDSTALLEVRPWATNPSLAHQLWTLSESLTGKFSP